MGRAAASAACLVLLGGLATGCAGEPEQSEINRWIDSQPDRGFGSVAAPVSPADMPAGRGDGPVGYDTSGGTVTGVELSCFQNDTLTFYVEVMRESRSTYSLDGTEVDVTCADGAHTEELDTTGADSVRIGVSGVENEGAWSAVFLGK